MAIRDFPDLADVLLSAFFVEGVTLDGGAHDTTGFSQVDDLFVDGSIFDGGSP